MPCKGGLPLSKGTSSVNLTDYRWRVKKPQIAYPLLFNDPYGFHYRDLLRDNHNKRYNENSYINNNQLVKSMNFQIKNGYMDLV